MATFSKKKYMGKVKHAGYCGEKGIGRGRGDQTYGMPWGGQTFPCQLEKLAQFLLAQRGKKVVSGRQRTVR